MAWLSTLAWRLLIESMRVDSWLGQHRVTTPALNEWL